MLCIDQVSKSERTDRSARITSSFLRILSCLASFMIPLNTASTIISNPIGAHQLQGQPPIIGVLVNHLLCLLHRSNVFGTTKGPVLQYLAIALSTKRSNRKWVLDGQPVRTASIDPRWDRAFFIVPVLLSSLRTYCEAESQSAGSSTPYINYGF